MLLAISFSYILVHGSHNIMRTGGQVSLESALARRDQLGGDFIWFAKGGHRYLIRDEATLQRIDHLFDAERSYDPDAERVERELRPLERRESELDHEIDALTDRDEGPPLTAAEEDRLSSVRREMDTLHRDMRVLEREQEELDHKRDALEADAERAMVPILDYAIRSGVATQVR